MPLTLREALSIAEPLRKSRVLAGEQGLDNVLKSVNVMEVPDILDWVRPGELLVTTMYPLRDDAAAIETLVPSLAKKNLAGLAITPSGYIDELPQCMVDAANMLDFPLIELPEKASFIDIIQPLTSRILDIQANELIQSERIHRQFIDLVLGGGGYSDIAQGIAQLLGCPVSIVDRFRRVLGNAILISDIQVQKRFIKDDNSGDSYLDDLYKPELVETIPRSTIKRMRVDLPEGPIDHIVCPVKIGARTLGKIVVWGSLSSPLQAADRIAMEHGSTVTALKMLEMRSVSEVEDRFRNEILEGLLSDQPESRERAIYLSREMGSHLSPPFTVILVRPDLLLGTPLTKAESAEQGNFDSSLHLATRYIHTIEPEVSFWYQGPRLVVFFPLQPKQVSDAKTFLINELRKVSKRIEAENAPYTVSMGISSPVHDLVGFRQAYESAKQSLAIGQAIQERSSNVIIHYEDLGLFRIVSLAESSTSLERFCQDTIGSLLSHDSEFGTELVGTLQAYLEQSQNSAKAARKLHIHYNTLRYRLERIKDLLIDDLDDPKQRLTIEVALRLYPLVVNANSS